MAAPYTIFAGKGPLRFEKDIELKPVDRFNVCLHKLALSASTNSCIPVLDQRYEIGFVDHRDLDVMINIGMLTNRSFGLLQRLSDDFHNSW